jgi:hypothetical protein
VLIAQLATLKDAETLKLDALREERKRNYQLAEQLWIRVLAISPADRDAIEAIRELACIIHEDFGKSSKALLGALHSDLAKKQSVF